MHLTWSGYADLYELAEEEERPPQPEVNGEWAWIWRAWHHLTDDRPKTLSGVALPMGGMMLRSTPGRITLEQLERWGRWEGLGAADLRFLAEVIGRMDMHFLAWWTKKQEQT